MPPIYLDYNASTPIDPAVAAAMRPFLEEAFGNPSSGHWASTPAKAALETGPRPGRRAARLRARGNRVHQRRQRSEQPGHQGHVLRAAAHKGEHIITTEVEHPAVLAPCRFLERLGGSVTYLPVDRTGRVDPDDVRRAITPQTILISVMHANNEVGTIQPIEEIGAHRAGAWHPLSHRRSAVGRKDPDQRSTSSASICSRSPATSSTRRRASARSIVRRGVELEPLIHGAGHESGPARRDRERTARGRARHGLRAGRDLAPMDRIHALRDRFWQALQDAVRRSRRAQRPSRRIGCPTRSTCRSSAGSAPTYWRSWTVSQHRRVRRAIRGASSSRPFLPPWACPRSRHGRDPLQPRAWDDARGNRRGRRTPERRPLNRGRL